MLIFNQGDIHGKFCFYFAETEGFLRAIFCNNRALNGEYNNSWTYTDISQFPTICCCRVVRFQIYLWAQKFQCVRIESCSKSDPYALHVVMATYFCPAAFGERSGSSALVAP